MKLFIDTADFREIQHAVDCGIAEGVTTNPSLIAKAGHKDFHRAIREICEICQGPVSAEVIGVTWQDMVREAKELAAVHPNVVVKIPMTEAGLQATRVLAEHKIPVNMTLIFTAAQGLLAARAGAAYVSPFIGRLEDTGADGLAVVSDLAEIFSLHGLDTQIIAASIRNPLHVVESAKAGAHIATIPWKTMLQMMQHPLTDSGLAKFLQDWQQLQDEKR